MSLQLRKQCQSILDGVNLDNYHVQVDPDSKMLQIVGECGQSLVSIAGIRLSRMAPNAAEIDLALELFDAFVAKHQANFKEFIKVKAVADSAKIPKSVEGLENAEIAKNRYQDYWSLTFDMKTREGKTVTAKSTGEIDLPSVKMDADSHSKDFLQATLTDAEVAAVFKWVNECNEFNIAVEAKADLLAKLSSCEI